MNRRRAGGELGFRFTPMFTLALSGGWRQFQSPSGVFNLDIHSKRSLAELDLGRGVRSEE
jgi:hypothetical protein